jgi:hypothetical protein
MTQTESREEQKSLSAAPTVEVARGELEKININVPDRRLKNPTDPLRHCHPNITIGPSPLGGKGLFAKAKIYAGEVVWEDEACFDTDDVLTYEQIERLDLDKRLVFLHFSYQIGEDKWSGVIDEAEAELDASHFYNHSCDPTTWFIDEVTMTARRDIEAGEEITFDYGTMYAFEWPEDIRKEALPHTIKCLCGAAKCRGKVTINDWKIPELRERYKGKWIPFIQKWIDAETTNQSN